MPQGCGCLLQQELQLPPGSFPSRGCRHLEVGLAQSSPSSSWARLVPLLPSQALDPKALPLQSPDILILRGSAHPELFSQTADGALSQHLQSTGSLHTDLVTSLLFLFPFLASMSTPFPLSVTVLPFLGGFPQARLVLKSLPNPWAELNPQILPISHHKPLSQAGSLFLPVCGIAGVGACFPKPVPTPHPPHPGCAPGLWSTDVSPIPAVTHSSPAFQTKDGSGPFVTHWLLAVPKSLSFGQSQALSFPDVQLSVNCVRALLVPAVPPPQAFPVLRPPNPLAPLGLSPVILWR